MKNEKLYAEFEDLAQRLGLKILKGKGDFLGGSCIVNNEKVIVINKSKPIEQRLNTLASCFNDYDLEDVFLLPALREYIEGVNKLDF